VRGAHLLVPYNCLQHSFVLTEVVRHDLHHCPAVESWDVMNESRARVVFPVISIGGGSGGSKAARLD
jgi:hypothetical protein